MNNADHRNVYKLFLVTKREEKKIQIMSKLVKQRSARGKAFSTAREIEITVRLCFMPNEK
jgi:hypothetical protein